MFNNKISEMKNFKLFNRIAISMMVMMISFAAEAQIFSKFGQTFTEPLPAQDENDINVPALNNDGNVLALATLDWLSNTTAGGPYADLIIRVYDANVAGNSWVQRGGDITFPGAGYTKQFTDLSISGDGNVVALHSPKEDNTDQLRIYEWNGTSWIQKGQSITPNVPTGVPLFNVNFSLNAILSEDGNTVATFSADPLGDPPSDIEFTSVYDYNSTTLQWEQRGGNLFVSNASSTIEKIIDLSGDGNRVLIVGQDTEVQEWNATTSSWQELGSSFGDVVTGSISEDGNTVALRTSTSNLVFDWNGTSWEQRGTSFGSLNYFDLIGYSLDISRNGNRVVLGNAFEGTFGNVQIFDWDGSAWVLVQTLTDNTDPDLFFGAGVAISDDGTTVAGITYDSGLSFAGPDILVTYKRVSFIQTENGPWNTPTNWSGGFVPTLNDNATIASGVTSTVSTNQQMVSLITEPGSVVTINNNITLEIKGDLTNNGDFEGDGYVVFDGSVPQQIIGDGTDAGSFSNIRLDNADGLTLTDDADITGVLDIDRGDFTVESGDFLTFKSDASNKTAVVDEVASGSSINGCVIVERYIPPKRAFRFLSSPVN
jgi:hypothetical protein